MQIVRPGPHLFTPDEDPTPPLHGPWAIRADLDAEPAWPADHPRTALGNDVPPRGILGRTTPSSLVIVVENTWPDRESPILEAIYRAMESGDDLGRAGREVVPDLPERVYQETLLTLAEDDYIEALVQRNAGDVPTVMPTRLLAKGRRAVGQWPGDDVAAELARVVQGLEDAERDPERKGRFRHLREALADAGKDVVARTIAELLKSMAGRVS